MKGAARATGLRRLGECWPWPGLPEEARGVVVPREVRLTSWGMMVVERRRGVLRIREVCPEPVAVIGVAEAEGTPGPRFVRVAWWRRGKAGVHLFPEAILRSCAPSAAWLHAGGPCPLSTWGGLVRALRRWEALNAELGTLPRYRWVDRLGWVESSHGITGFAWPEGLCLPTRAAPWRGRTARGGWRPVAGRRSRAWRRVATCRSCGGTATAARPPSLARALMAGDGQVCRRGGARGAEAARPGRPLPVGGVLLLAGERPRRWPAGLPVVDAPAPPSWVCGELADQIAVLERHHGHGGRAAVRWAVEASQGEPEALHRLLAAEWDAAREAARRVRIRRGAAPMVIAGLAGLRLLARGYGWPPEGLCAAEAGYLATARFLAR